MLILEKSGELLQEYNTLAVYHETIIGHRLKDKSSVTLGEYRSKERAKEILKEITKSISNGDKVFIMPER